MLARTLHAFILLLTATLVLPPQVLAGFIPSVVDRSEQNVQAMAEERVALEERVLTEFYLARGYTPEKTQQTLKNYGAVQRRQIFLKDIPSYEANTAGKNAALTLAALPLAIFLIWLNTPSKDSDRDTNY